MSHLHLPHHHPGYVSPIGLDRNERRRARDLACYAAIVAYKHRAEMVYTEGPARWSGIDDHRLGYKGEFPRAADCSAFTTWCLWNGVEHFRIKQDIVNGEEWREGYTGTMVQHGVEVDVKHLLTGDAIFYGGTRDVPQHVCLYMGWGRVMSHGSPGDPSLLPIDFGMPFNQARRYIR
jgi:NlpC/P60 family